MTCFCFFTTFLAYDLGFFKLRALWFEKEKPRSETIITEKSHFYFSVWPFDRKENSQVPIMCCTIHQCLKTQNVVVEIDKVIEKFEAGRLESSLENAVAKLCSVAPALEAFFPYWCCYSIVSCLSDDDEYLSIYIGTPDGSSENVTLC